MNSRASSMRGVRQYIAVIDCDFVMLCSIGFAQQDETAQPESSGPVEESIPAPVVTEIPPPPAVERGHVKLLDISTIVMSSLRPAFPALAPMFASSNSCRLPNYILHISLILQIPILYITWPPLE